MFWRACGGWLKYLYAIHKISVQTPTSVWLWISWASLKHMFSSIDVFPISLSGSRQRSASEGRKVKRMLSSLGGKTKNKPFGISIKGQYVLETVQRIKLALTIKFSSNGRIYNRLTFANQLLINILLNFYSIFLSNKTIYPDITAKCNRFVIFLNVISKFTNLVKYFFLQIRKTTYLSQSHQIYKVVAEKFEILLNEN